MVRHRHIPQRTCIACRQIRNKRDLVRVVRTPEGSVVIDPTGKRAGRGAYLCRAQGCRRIILDVSGRRLSQALKAPLTAETVASLREFAASLPPTLLAEGEETKAAPDDAGDASS